MNQAAAKNDAMRAIVLHSPGDIRLEERPRPEAGPGQVLVRVASVGVCGSDLPRMLVKGAWKMPLITGHEFAGHSQRNRRRGRGLGYGRTGRDRPAPALRAMQPVPDRQLFALRRLRLFRQPSRRRLCRIRRGSRGEPDQGAAASRCARHRHD